MRVIRNRDLFHKYDICNDQMELDKKIIEQI
jgi:hypothetical protein